MASDGKRDIVVIAVWVGNLVDVYSAEVAASKLRYSDMGLDPARKLWHHCEENPVNGGIAADEYRVLAVFEGGGPDRNVIFAYPLYQISTPIPSGFFPGRDFGCLVFFLLHNPRFLLPMIFHDFLSHIFTFGPHLGSN